MLVKEIILKLLNFLLKKMPIFTNKLKVEKQDFKLLAKKEILKLSNIYVH